MGNVVNKILQVLGAIFLVLILGIALGVLVNFLLGPPRDTDSSAKNPGAISGAETSGDDKTAAGQDDAEPPSAEPSPEASPAVELTDGQIAEIAKVSTLKDAPYLVFDAYIEYIFVTRQLEENIESLQWVYGWDDENAPAASPPVPGSSIVPATYIMTELTEDKNNPDERISGQAKLFFELDIQRRELEIKGAVMQVEGEEPVVLPIEEIITLYKFADDMRALALDGE